MPKRIVVIGVGNDLCQDDGVGPLIVRELARRHRDHPAADWIDGGTVGLALLGYIEGRDGLIVVDAAALGAAPGHVEVLQGEAMDQFATHPRKRSVHELGLADLLSAARLSGALPAQRALVAIEPKSTALGVTPSTEVGAAIDSACDAVLGLIRAWEPATTAKRTRHLLVLPEGDAPCATPTGPLAHALMPEIAQSVADLASAGTSSTIDLRSLPMTDDDRAALSELLGRGEVSIVVSVAGNSEVWETRYPGVWWVRHRAVDGEVLADFVEIARVPEIVLPHPEDISRSQRQLASWLDDQRSAVR